MANSFSRSFQLAKESFRLLLLDKELLLFPLLSGFFVILILITFIFPLFFAGALLPRSAFGLAYYLWLFMFYLASYLISISKIIISLAGIAWTFATFFIIPVMIFENLGVIDSIKKSSQIFKNTWGESVIGQFGMGFFFTILVLFSAAVSFILGFLFSSGKKSQKGSAQSS